MRHAFQSASVTMPDSLQATFDSSPKPSISLDHGSSSPEAMGGLAM
jgi:hypothetical protein